MKVSKISNFNFSAIFKYFMIFIVGFVLGFLLNQIDAPYNLQKVDYNILKGFTGNGGGNTGQIININLPELNGSIVPSSSNGVFFVSLNLNSNDEVKINFSFDDNELSIYGLKPISTMKNSGIMGGKNVIQIINNGNNKFMFLLKDKYENENKIDMQVISGNNIIYSTSINTL